MSRYLIALIGGLILLTAGKAQTPELQALARLPVKEVTVFKDGHAYVIHEGRATVEASREVRMDYLPTPILGTFWVYSPNAATPVRAVTASVRRVMVERTALTLPDLLAANPGAEVTIQEKGGKPYRAKIVGYLTRSSAEIEETSPPNTDPQLPERSNLLLLETGKGTLTVPVDRIESVAFLKSPRTKLAQEEFRNVLTAALPDASPGSQTDIGLMYVQKGLRWIPSYRVDIDGKGTAQIRLQATLINELTDLHGATVHLVVGVPTFAFEQTPDPMSLQQTFARLSPYFDKSSSGGRILGQAVAAQVVRMAEADGAASMPGLGPELESEGKTEDYYVFTIRNVSLKKGARMVLPVAETSVPYRDVYTLTIPFTPPAQLRAEMGLGPESPGSRPGATTRVLHKLRLTNTSLHPLTTAPALILLQGRVLAQGTMTYAAVGASTDLTLTTAVDIAVKRTDTETGRNANALTVDKVTYGRTDFSGKINLTNYKAIPVEVEVVRYIVGQADRAEANGEAVNVDPLMEEGLAEADQAGMRAFPWPSWWSRVNGLGRFRWTVAVPPGQTIELGYTWHYFWR